MIPSPISEEFGNVVVDLEIASIPVGDKSTEHHLSESIFKLHRGLM
jgi:hypothetical protein